MYLKTYRLAFLFLCLCFSQYANAQKIVRHANQQWVQYYNQLKINDSWILMTDGGFRWSDKFQLKALFIGRLGMAYKLNTNFHVAAGLATTGAYNSSSFSRLELRPYQELFNSLTVRRMEISQRLRIEERYFKDVVDGVLQDDHAFNFRFRYQISTSLPILKLSKKNPDCKLYMNIADEVFVNAGKEIVYNVFDKNRIIIGPTVQLNKSLAIGLSYVSQFSQLNAPGLYTQDDVIWMTVRHSIHLNKSSKLSE